MKWFVVVSVDVVVFVRAVVVLRRRLVVLVTGFLIPFELKY